MNISGRVNCYWLVSKLIIKKVSYSIKGKNIRVGFGEETLWRERGADDKPLIIVLT